MKAKRIYTSAELHDLEKIMKEKQLEFRVEVIVSLIHTAMAANHRSLGIGPKRMEIFKADMIKLLCEGIDVYEEAYHTAIKQYLENYGIDTTINKELFKTK